MICVFLLGAASARAASGTASVFYFTGNYGELGTGTTVFIQTKLTTMGYTAGRYNNYSRNTILSMMGNCKVFHILTHGNTGFFSIGQTAGGGTITYSNISSSFSSLSDLRFAFIEACYTGSTPDFQNALFNLSAKASLVFKNTISASTSYDGIHYFADRLYNYAKANYNLSFSRSNAELDMLAYDGYSHGCDQYRLYGGNKTIS